MARRRRSERPTEKDDSQCKTSNAGKRGGFDKAKAHNDISWYALNPQILRDAGQLSFNNAVGGKVDFGFSSNITPYAVTTQSVAGIMRINFAPSVGISTDNSSAVNLASRDIYAFVRHANSGSSNYDAPDLMLYLLAMDSIYSLWNMGKRAYGLMMYYSQYNRYLPAGLVQASGFDFTDLEANLANMRYALNVAAAKINALYVPNVMKYVERHSWMVSNVYKDSDNLKAQMYVHRMALMHMLVEQGPTPGLMLQAVQIPENLTVSSFTILLNRALGLVIESEDMNIMAGDLRKAYGPEKAFLLSPVTEEYAIEAVYNEEVLNQIHNLNTWGAITSTQLPSWNITIVNDTNTITFNPDFANTFAIGYHDIIINMPWDIVTPENVLKGTRLISACNTSGPVAVGTEIVLSWDIFQFYGDNVNSWKPYTVTGANGTYVSFLPTLNSLRDGTVVLTATSQFDWHPLIWVTYTDTDTASTIFTGLLGDLSNYTVVDAATVKKMHDTALLSEFGVPINGRI